MQWIWFCKKREKLYWQRAIYHILFGKKKEIERKTEYLIQHYEMDLILQKKREIKLTERNILCFFFCKKRDRQKNWVCNTVLCNGFNFAKKNER